MRCLDSYLFNWLTQDQCLKASLSHVLRGKTWHGSSYRLLNEGDVALLSSYNVVPGTILGFDFILVYVSARLVGGTMFSMRSFVRPSFSPSVCALLNSWTQYFWERRTNFAENWYKWSSIMGQGHEAVNFGGQEVQGRDHRRPELDLEA